MKLFNKYKFSDKSQTLGGMISTVMGLAALVSFGYGIYIAFQAKGNAGLEVGSLGLLSFMLSVIGLVIGLVSFKEEDKLYTFSSEGALMGGIFAIFMVAVLMMGIV